jgi:hypothetical protein
MYSVQVQQNNGSWLTILGFREEQPASVACYRAVFAYKKPSRVFGEEDKEIVYERFYNVSEDPDENWRDDLEEDHDISWQEAGF